MKIRLGKRELIIYLGDANHQSQKKNLRGAMDISMDLALFDLNHLMGEIRRKNKPEDILAEEGYYEGVREQIEYAQRNLEELMKLCSKEP